MPEQEMPRSPFRERQNPEDGLMSEEIKAVLGIFEFTRRLRAKVPENPTDIDKSRENTSESAGDHTAMTAYLMQYFLPLVEGEGVQLDYGKTLDMTLAHDIGNIENISSPPGVQQDLDVRRREIESTAKAFGELPDRNGFNRSLFDAYAEYLGQETREARFVRALNGLETMLYVLSRPPQVRADLVGGKGYAIEDYRDRIEPFCREFPPLQQFYTRIERIFHGKKYFAPSRTYGNQIMRPETARNIFVANVPDFADNSNIDPNSENERLLKLQRLKRRLRFGQSPKPEAEHNDTVPEHVSSLLLLARYFVPSLKTDPAQASKERLSLREVCEMILAHDIPEIIRGDTVTARKTEADAQEEWDVAAEIADLAPRAGGFNEEFWTKFDAYETARDEPPFVGDAWLVKCLDVFEAQLYIFDPETREKLPHMHAQSREQVRGRIDRALNLFPLLKEHFDALEQKFREEGVS